ALRVGLQALVFFRKLRIGHRPVEMRRIDVTDRLAELAELLAADFRRVGGKGGVCLRVGHLFEPCCGFRRAINCKLVPAAPSPWPSPRGEGTGVCCGRRIPFSPWGKVPAGG